MVYLTATLKPSEEDEFGRLMGIGKGIWFRAPTRRTNVAYRVVMTEDEDKAVQALVARKRREYQGQGQIIVYCGTRAQTEHVAELVGGVYYHAKAGSASEKAAILRRLVEEKDQVFAATNALGLGVDAARIRVVVHVGTVRRMRDYAQESGRAGRDGLGSEAIMMCRADETLQQMRRAGVEEEMAEYITTDECKRVVLDRVMDGQGARCGDGDEACSSCRESVDGPDGPDSPDGPDGPDSPESGSEEFEAEMGRRQAAEMAERERDRERIGREDELESALEKWKSGCCWCRAGDEECEGHGLQECLEAEDFRVWKKDKEAGIRWQGYASCWDCGTPQALCVGWRARSNNRYGWERSGRQCQYPGVLTAAVFALWAQLGEDEARRIGCEQMAREGIASEKLEWWLGRKRMIGGMEGSNMCEMLLLLDK